MSYVVAETGLLQAAASDLAGIRTALADAASVVAGPTTGVMPAAADEVSGALASLFGNFGEQFQVLNAQAQAFHTQFVAMMNSGAGAYLSTELANAEQAIASVASTPAQSLLGGGLSGLSGGGSSVSAASGGGLLGGLLGGTTSGGPGLGGTVGGLLGGLTGSTGSGLGGTVGGLLGGGTGLGGVVSGLTSGLTGVTSGLTGLTSGLGGLTSGLTGLTSGLGGLGGLLGGTTGLGGLLGGLTGGTGGLGGLLGGLTGGTGGLGGILGGLTGGLGGLGDLGGLLGGLTGGLGDLGSLVPGLQGALQGLENSLTGIVNSLLPGLLNIDIGSTGTAFTGLFGPYEELFANTFANLQSLGSNFLADPFPFLHQILVNQVGYGETILTALQTGNFAPVSAIPGEIATNFGNVAHTLTDFSITPTVELLGAGGPVVINNMVGLPILAGAALIGAPAAGFQALSSSAFAFQTALGAGNVGGAFAALFDAPAVFANGLLNGHAYLPYALNVDALANSLVHDLGLGGIIPPALLPQVANITASAQLPLDGLLVQPGYYPLTVHVDLLGGLLPPIVANLGVGGTPFSGLLPLGINYAPQQLAYAIGAPPPATPPIVIPL
jgi:PE family